MPPDAHRPLFIIVAAAMLAAAALPACRDRARTPEAPAGSSAEGTGRPATVRAHPPTPLAGVAPSGPSQLLWSVPEGWIEEEPASAMRKAQFRLPAAPGDVEGGECAVFYFGAGQGGDVRGNVERWTSQFKGPGGDVATSAVSEVAISGLTITRVEVKGAYTPSPMMMGGGAAPPERPGYMLLGAIVPGAEANWFIRCAGPERTITAHRGRFDAFLASIRPAG